MKILLIQPPIRDFYRTRFREYPLGLLYIAASLRKHGHECEILDARYSAKSRGVTLPEEFSYLKKYYTKENNLFLGYKHFGLSFEEIGKRVLKLSPDYILVSSMFTPYLNEVLETAYILKASLPNVPIIVGGHHATADPDSLLASDCIDRVVRGEGEEILLNVINKGQYVDSESSRVKDLDQLPFPARDLIDPLRYSFKKKPYTMLLTSRGCPHRCSFCSVHTMCGHKHRTHSIDYVLSEIDECVNKHGIRAIDFQDDNLLFDSNRIKDLFDRILCKYEGVDIEWMASNGLNAAHLDVELLKLMKSLGFKKLDIALATSDVPTRKKLNRPEHISKYEEVLNLAVSVGLDVTTYIIIGIPTQPIAELKATVEYLKEKPTLISPSIFYNVPGMPVYNDMKKYEYISEHMARRSSAFNCFGDDFKRDDIFRLFKEIRDYNIKKTAFFNFKS